MSSARRINLLLAQTSCVLVPAIFRRANYRMVFFIRNKFVLVSWLVLPITATRLVCLRSPEQFCTTTGTSLTLWCTPDVLVLLMSLTLLSNRNLAIASWCWAVVQVVMVYVAPHSHP